MNDAIANAAAACRPYCGDNCRIGLILGSGLGVYADKLDGVRYVDYAAIEGFPRSSVAGHAGRFAIGDRFSKRVIAMQGRFHYYEGHPPVSLTAGVRAMRRLGVTHLLITNAAGGVDESFSPGDLMLITDHINFSGSNPLIGANDDSFGPRFPDVGNAYDRILREAAKACAAGCGLSLREGVYMMFSGPCYETPAEIRMARVLGASAVGMSTVPEAITAAHCGMRTLGISLITNMAAGILDQPLSHEEVQAAADMAAARFSALIDGIIREVF